MKARDWGNVLKKTFAEFWRTLPLHHGAALSYYAVIALVPILYLAVSFIGSFLGEEKVLEIITNVLKQHVGVSDMDGITSFLSEVQITDGSIVMRIVGIGALMISSTAILSSLKRSMNELYGLGPLVLSRSHLILRSVIFRFVSMVSMMVITSAIVAVYFVETFIFSVEERYLSDREVLTWIFSNFANHGIPILMNFVVFTFLFKYLHDGIVAWRVAIVGGIATGFFLYCGQLLIKSYLSHFFFASGSGVAGAILVILVWIYYTSQILFIGAKFTQVYANYIEMPIRVRTAKEKK